MSEVRTGADGRRHDLDWVRVIAILSVVFYHAAQPFTGKALAVNAAEPSRPLAEFCYFFNQWRMPLVFCIAGAASWIMLQRRTGPEYLHERVRRLIIPLAFAVLVFLPPQLYLRGQYTESFAAFYPHFIEVMVAQPLVRWGHLWFLAYLLLADAFALPVLLLLRRGAGGQRMVARAGAALARPYAILALALPLAVVRCIPTRWVGDWTVFHVADFKTFALYLVVFAYGYLLASSGASWDSAVRQRRVALAFAVVTQGAVYALRAVADAPDSGAHPIASRLLDFVGALGMWFWVVTVLAYARRYLHMENAALRYAREATYPVYLLHYTVVMVIAAPFARSGAPVAVRFAGLTTATIAITLVLYEIVVKRNDATRFVFGL